jgi:hypothetical protein
MKKKIICLALCIFLLVPVTSATGISQKPELITNNIVEQLDIDPNIVDMINQINKSLVSGYLTDLVDIGPRFTGSNNCKKAANYIFDEFEDMGLDTYIDNWKYLRYKSQNIIATLNGTDPSSDAVFIVFSHYDTITFPSFLPKNHSLGANCGGSGIAVLLAVAKIMSKYSFNHTVRFIAFSGEHEGCFGSNNYARNAYFENENIIGVFNLDALGEANSERDGNIVNVAFQQRSEWFFDSIQTIKGKYECYLNLTLWPDVDLPCDHASFYHYGFDGLMFQQFASMEHVDSPEDTIDKINFTYLTKISKLVVALTSELASKPIDLQIRIISPYEDYVYLLNKPLLKLPDFNLDRLKYDGATICIGSCLVKVNVTSIEELEKIAFSIDGIKCPTPSSNVETEWRIQGFLSPLIGWHTLGVFAYTKSGKIAYDEMDIFIITSRFFYKVITPFWQKWRCN